MRGILALLVIVYLVGIGVVLAPTVQGEWNTGTASEFVGKIVQELPVAAAWPVTLYHRMMDRVARVGAVSTRSRGVPATSPPPPANVAVSLARAAILFL